MGGATDRSHLKTSFTRWLGVGYRMVQKAPFDPAVLMLVADFVAYAFRTVLSLPCCSGVSVNHRQLSI